MEVHLRQRWRAAQRIIEQLTVLHHRRQHELDERLAYAGQRLDGLRSLSRKLARARQHGLHGARRRVQQQLPVTVNELMHLLGDVSSVLSRSAAPPPIPTVRQLLDALEQLDDEFGELTLDDKCRYISVTTEPIALEGVELGRFEIRLYLDDLSSLSGPRPYEVLALDPNPPAGEDHVTHPHVSDNHLCEGEGASAIRFALERGALGEFFLLVHAALNTYNAESPYVSLDAWHGVACADCGDRIDSDDAYACHRCGDELCGSCAGRCECCDEAFCPNCGGTCAQCHEPACEKCLTTCPGCWRSICADCLEHDDLCPACRAEQDDEELPDEEQDPLPAEGAPTPAGSTAVFPAAADGPPSPAPPSPAIIPT
ncbi:hypothetical protein ACERK3_16215 [Phycisphaerales bacterium AB-hyl4]|uniref:RING-type domain-containing protein n=1 Tax=Natronomicrosphaera hydrolytica TaxID=3242702 RepID=A0ABV4UB18_9BACT